MLLPLPPFQIDPLVFWLAAMALMGLIVGLMEKDLLGADVARRQVPATVGGKRTEVRYIPPDTKMRGRKQPVYFLTFVTGSGGREYRVDRRLFDSVSPGDRGFVLIQGEWFQGFRLARERVGATSQNAAD